jgi:hypothetical protein
MINLGPKGASKGGHTKTLPEQPFQKPKQTAAFQMRFSAVADVVPGAGRWSNCGHGQSLLHREIRQSLPT